MKRLYRFLSPFPIILVALLLVLPTTAQAAPSIRVAMAPLTQTVKTGQQAVFTVAVKNTGDTILSPILIMDDSASECNRNFTGLLPGRVMVFTCSHRGERRSYSNGVRATGSSAIHRITVSNSASASIVIEPLSVEDLLGSSFMSGWGLRIPYVTGFLSRYPAGGSWKSGAMNRSAGMDATVTYLDTGTATALLMISNASETSTGSTGDHLNGREGPGATEDLSVTWISRMDVFTRGEEGYYFYYDPVVKFTPDGSLILFADAWKPNETDPGFRTPTINLVYKRSTDNGVTWSPMEILDDPGELWCAFNPSAVVDWQTGRIWIFYLLSPAGRDIFTSRPGTNDMQIMARWSDDSGLSWSDPRDLTALTRDMSDPSWTGSVPGPGGAIQTSKGRLLVPIWKMPFADFVIFSDDHGITWQRGQLVPNPQGGCENQMVELPDGRVLMDIRQIDGPHRWLAESIDGGETWSGPWPSLNVTPVRSAMEPFTYQTDEGERNCILWTGPRGLPWNEVLNGRWFLTLRVSCDGGRTFPAEHQISEETASYSDLTVLNDNTVGVVWESGEQSPDENITFARFSIHPGPRHE